MRGLDAESIDAIVTDPPYGLSFMGKDWDHGIPGESYWREALRVAKPGTHLLAFGGTRTFHRLTVAIEDAGWEIRDCIMWVYGSGFPKSHNLKGEWQGWGTALKPAWEPIIVARKPLVGTVAANVIQYGCGGVNVDGCRVGHPVDIPPRRAGGKAAQASDICFASDEHTKNMQRTEFVPTSGRWPANLIHDGSDEVTGLFPVTSSGEIKVSHLRATSKTKSAYSQRDALPETYPASSGSAARFFYCAKASKVDRDDGNHHPTVKPTDLMRYLCRLVTQPGGTVLDPFCGSGSTGKAAVMEGFQFVGIELNPEYAAIAEARIAHARELTPLLRGVQ
jgi:site-specific DNA-methyltransferase (adenine-specific)